MTSRAEFFYRIAARQRHRTWPEVMAKYRDEDAEMVEQRLQHNLDASTELQVQYDRSRKWRRWRWCERIGRRSKYGQTHGMCTTYVGRWRLTEDMAIADRREQRARSDDCEHNKWASNENLIDWLLSELTYNRDHPDPYFGTKLLEAYEPNVSTRFKALYPVWAWAYTYQYCPYPRTQWLTAIQIVRVLNRTKRLMRTGRNSP